MLLELCSEGIIRECGSERKTKIEKKTKARSNTLPTTVGTFLVIGDDILMTLGFQPVPYPQAPLGTSEKVRVLRCVLIGLVEHADDLLAPRRGLRRQGIKLRPVPSPRETMRSGSDQAPRRIHQANQNHALTGDRGGIKIHKIGIENPCSRGSAPKIQKAEAKICHDRTTTQIGQRNHAIFRQ